METKTNIPKEVLIAAIIGIVAIEIVALLKGVDGKFLAISIGAIGALAGLVLPQIKLK